ncbi:MAG: L-rhamnose mutarotase [Candidatus Limivivens sp.]|nr:L-rhamnose mutarotase [Candidatus Limivivens sp.]
MRRFGQVIRLKPEFEEKYKALHANPWPEVNAMIKECNIQNYSIFLKDGWLFAYMEYTGEDFEADMVKMGQDEATKRWWKETDPCQYPVDPTSGEWWSNMEEVYHLD